jgi:hypothetical protein
MDSLNRRTFLDATPTRTSIVSILRVSAALDVADFKPRAIRFFKILWPETLASVTKISTPQALPITAIEAVVLARTWQVPFVLKRALYEIACLEGFGTQNKGRGTLSCSDITLLVTVREKLSSLWISMAAIPLYDLRVCTSIPSVRDDEVKPGDFADSTAPPNGLLQTHRCTTTDSDRAQKSHTRLVHTSGIFKNYLNDPIRGFRILAEASWLEDGFCEQCVAKRQTRWLGEREKLWNDLDNWFGLASA